MAVPSIFTVAPIGRVKFAIFSDTPDFSLTLFMVSGNAAAEEAVENAVNKAEAMLFRCLTGLFLPNRKVNKGRVTNECTKRGAVTQTMKLPRLPRRLLIL